MKKHLLIIIGLILLLAACGNSVEIDGKKTTYEELEEKIKEKEDELDELIDELTEYQEYHATVIELANNEAEMKESIDQGKEELEELNEDITSKEKELNTLEGEILEYSDKPIEINPGVYHFGNDIDTGRYKIMNQEGYNGNVFFRGSNGFGETFGNGKYSIKEYTFYAEDGDEIEATIPILLYPVE